LASVVLRPIPASSASRRRAIALAILALLPVAGALSVLAARLWPSVGPALAQAPAPPPADEADRRLSEAIDRARASTVALEYGAGDSAGKRRMATGVVVSDRGDVLTVRVDPPTGRDRETILARDAAGHRHPARWMAADPETGLTLLRVEADDIRPIRPAARAALVGAAIFVIGNPYGLAHSVGRGHIAGLGRHVEIGPRPLGGLIQVQAPLHPGDSGALLADLDGGWLGLIRGGLASPGARAERDEDFGFAIPAVDALWVADQLRLHRKVDRAHLGLRLAVDAVEPAAGAGVEVTGVIAGSPADRAGLRKGDRIARLDDRPIRSADDLSDRLDRTCALSEVALEYVRDGAHHRLPIRTASRPPEPPTPPASPRQAEPAPRELLRRIEVLERRFEELDRRDRKADAP